MNSQYSTWTRHFLTLLVLIAGLLGLALPASAQDTAPTSDEINDAILLPGSIRPEWIQPDVYPWQIDENLLYCTGESDITFTYISDKPTVIVCCKNDGRYWGFNFYENEKCICNTSGGNNMINLPPGEHNVIIEPSSHCSSYSNLNSFGIYEVSDIINSTHILSPKSKQVEIINDSQHPWFIFENNILASSRGGDEEDSSVLKFKFTIDDISSFSWEQKVINVDNAYNLGSNTFIYKEDNLVDQLDNYPDNAEWIKHALVLFPGDYEISLKELQFIKNDGYYHSGRLQTQIRNVKLNDEWFEVTTTAGDLGNCVIDAISGAGYTRLDDVEMLKVKGQFNLDDWANVSKMTNLMALDIEETNASVIPGSQFSSNKVISYVKLPTELRTINYKAFYESNIKYIDLPEGLTEIREGAFYNTKIQHTVFPSTLEKIGKEAFCGSWLNEIKFAPNSKFNELGYCAFMNCKYLESVELPNSLNKFVTIDVAINVETGELTGSVYYNYTINGAFLNCINLKTITFPKSLKVIPSGICVNTPSLKQVVLPEDVETIDKIAFANSGIMSIDLPNTIRSIRESAFRKFKSLSETYIIQFPDSLEKIENYAFHNGNLSEVKMPRHLQYLGSNVFDGNKNLKTFTMHENAKNLTTFLKDCDALETIILPCAIPPTRYYYSTSDEYVDMLGNQEKKKINLIVPEFAKTMYAIDSYWSQFGIISSGEEADNQENWKIDGNLVLRDGRRMQGAPDVEVCNNSSMTIVGDTPANFKELKLHVKNDNYYLSASSALLNYCQNVSTESLQVRFEVTSHTWYMLTPMFDVNLSDIIVTNTDNYVFRYYDAESRAAGTVSTSGASANWKNVTESQLKAGVGYIFQCDTDSEIIFPASNPASTPVFSTSQSDYALESHESESISNAGWNLIGNPYPSYFDIWHLDVEAPITVCRHSGIHYEALSVTDDDYILRPMEAFFIQKPEEFPQAVFNPEGRQANNKVGDHTGRSVSARRAARAKETRNLFNIEIRDNEGNELDRTRVVINENASMDYEIRYDAAKFMSEGAQLYTIDPAGNQMAINERPLADGEALLGIKTGADRSYTIEASRADGEVWLVDLKTDAEYDLTEGAYTLFAEPNSTIEGRYLLRFAPVETGVDGAPVAKARVEAGAGFISIENPRGENVAIYGLDGSETLRSSESAIRAEAAPGIYLVRFGSKTHKVIVK